MKKPIPWGRVIATVLAVVAFAAAVPSTCQWWNMRTECADAQATLLAVLPEAFGTNGTVEVDFCPKYSFTCKEMLLVEHDLPNRSPETVSAVLKGLQAQVAIIDRTGKAVLEKEVTDEWFRPFWADRGINSALPALLFHPVQPGSYRLRVTVREPAIPLIGVPHRVVARYELCGIERLAAAFTGGIALVAIMIGLSLTMGVILVTRRRTKHSNPSSLPIAAKRGSG